MSAKHLYQTIKQIETEFGSVDRVKRDEYVAVALGAIAASLAPLPTSEVMNPTNHWLLQHEGNLKRVLSEVNELYIFDIKLALTIARQVYLARYRRVYDVGLIISELTILLPDHVSKLPPVVGEVFSTMTEEQKHTFGNALIPGLKEALGLLA